MRKILLIARRDFLATVSTKGFIIAIMVPLGLVEVVRTPQW